MFVQKQKTACRCSWGTHKATHWVTIIWLKSLLLEIVEQERRGLCGSYECFSNRRSLLFFRKENSFIEECRPRMLDNYKVTVQFDGEDIPHSLWDTAGAEDCDRIRPVLFYPGTDLFVFTASIDSPASFENILTKWLPEVNKDYSHVGKLIVGTKQDLREDEETPQNTKKSLRPYDEGVALAKEVGAIGYLECSAKTQEGLSPLFDEIFRYFLSIKRTGSREYHIPIQRSKAKSARK